jgi:hypothetical protein
MTKSTHYGLLHDLQIEYNRKAAVIYFTGITELDDPFEAVLTKRAMLLFWSRLTQALYPNDAPTMIAMSKTAPLPSDETRQLTIRIDLRRLEDGNYEIIGGVTQGEWVIRVSESDARRLWADLDILLYPYGWEGREGRPGGDEGAGVR